MDTKKQAANGRMSSLLNSVRGALCTRDGNLDTYAARNLGDLLDEIVREIEKLKAR
jgi:hypothetical protein